MGFKSLGFECLCVSVTGCDLFSRFQWSGFRVEFSAGVKQDHDTTSPA